MNTLRTSIFEKIMVLALGAFIIPAALYNVLGFFSNYTGSFGLNLVLLGAVGYFCTIIAYRAIINTTLRDTMLISSLMVMALGIHTYNDQLPSYIVFPFVIMVLSSLWLIIMSKRFGLPEPLYPIRILLGLACITSTYVISCLAYSSTFGAMPLAYWALFACFIVFILGLQLILSGFNLTVTPCLPKE